MSQEEALFAPIPKTQYLSKLNQVPDPVAPYLIYQRMQHHLEEMTLSTSTVPDTKVPLGPVLPKMWNPDNECPHTPASPFAHLIHL